MKPATLPGFEVSPFYFAASYPYGKPVAPRRECYVSSLACNPVPGVLGLTLPLSAWKITVYDDKPRVFAVRLSSDSPVWFQAKSLRAALAGIAERCDNAGALLG